MSDFNPDTWLAGLERPYEAINLYQKPSAATRLSQVQDELAKLREQAERDGLTERALDEDPIGDLEREEAELWEELAGSALELHVTTLDRDQQDAIVVAATESAQEDQDRAVKLAKANAQRDLDRVGEKDTKRRAQTINDACRSASASVLNEHIKFHSIAAAAHSAETGEPVFTAEQWRHVSDVLGSVQVNRIYSAANRVASKQAEVTAPKSQTPGASDEDQALSS